jgi:hypothetical protein
MMGIGGQFKALREKAAAYFPLTVRMYCPIHPLLLISAISISRLKSQDFKSFLLLYSRGLDVNGLEESLLRLDLAVGDEGDIAQVLEIEGQYRAAMLEWAGELVVSQGRLIEQSGEPTIWDLYWACWVIANPIFRYDPLPARDAEGSICHNQLNGFSRGIRWGMQFNSEIHNAREHYEYSLKLINEQVNSLLDNPVQDEEKMRALKDVLARQQTAALLAARAFRIYEWGPDEINANSIEAITTSELLESALRDGAGPAEIAALQGLQEGHGLPARMRERLKPTGKEQSHG